MSTWTLNSVLALTLLSASHPVPAQFIRLPQGQGRQPPATPAHTSATAVPATAPTAAAAPTPPQAIGEQSSSIPAHRATVLYTKGDLTINAANSSLNQILQDVARTSNMKITGGVAEERVFGNYGPGSPLEVITALLDGTGANIMFVEGEKGQSSELILTTRNGAPTPPNPNAGSNTEDADTPDPNSPVMPVPTVATPPGPAPPAGAAFDQAPPVPDPDAATQNGANSQSNSQSSGSESGVGQNGTKTPQQIYDELMKLRQQQNQQQPQ